MTNRTLTKQCCVVGGGPAGMMLGFLLARAGVPEMMHQAADARLLIPMAAGLRSLNVAVAAAMVLGEALRQTAAFPLRAEIETEMRS